VTDPWKNIPLIVERIGSCHAQYKVRTTLSALMLPKEKNACLGSFGSGPKAKPRRRRNASCVLGSNTAQIQNNRTEAAGLQKQIGHAEPLFDPCKRIYRCRPETLPSVEFNWFKYFSLRPQFVLRLGESRCECSRIE